MALLDLVRDLSIAISDTMRGRDRRRYEYAIDIAAPRDIVWSMLKANDIEFDGRFPLRVVSQPVSGRPGVDRVQILAGAHSLTMMTMIADEREGQAILYRLLPEGTDPALIEGDDDYVGFVLMDIPGGTRLDLTRETTPRHFLSRLTVPVGLRSGARRYKRKAEAMYAAPTQFGSEGSGE